MRISRYTYPPGAPTPLFDRAHLQERRYPWKYGIGYMLRLPLTRHALVIGLWKGKRPSVDDGDGPRLDMRTLEDWENYVRQED